MDKEELEKLRLTVKEWLFHTGSLSSDNYADELLKTFIKPRENRITELEQHVDKIDKEMAGLKAENADLKEALDFYKKEQYEIANDNTIQEVMKDLEKHQEEVTVDDYSPYDENTWGMMHEEMYVPKELAKEYLVECHTLSEHRKTQLDKAVEIIEQLLLLPYASNEEVCADVSSVLYEADQFVKNLKPNNQTGDVLKAFVRSSNERT